MRRSCLAVLALVFGAVAFEAVTPGQAPGQMPAAMAQPAPAVQGTTASAPLAAGQAAGTPYAYDLFTTTLNRPTSKEMELERQSRDLARQYGKTENRDERDKIRDNLNDVLRHQFDAQQQRRRDEIQRIEEQLKKLRDLMQKREDAKSSIVQRRLEQLLQEAEGLGWTTIEPGLSGVQGWSGVSPAPGGFGGGGTIRR